MSGKIRKFGLLGQKLDYSFSKKYFEAEYHKHYSAPAEYRNHELPTADLLLPLVREQNLEGLNVTIPYKEAVIPFLDEISPEAERIGAVNTLKIARIGEQIHIKGYNTDSVGFEESVRPYVTEHCAALVLGTGGAAKTVAYVLEKYGMRVTFVSRGKGAENCLTYDSLTADIVSANTLIVNATPMGTLDFGSDVALPYAGITPRHFCMDLVYNPPTTVFMEECALRGAKVCNGLEMLHRQAEEAWKIWNS